ncbi:unnamed protein product [Gadus morhua 'NCC']
MSKGSYHYPELERLRVRVEITGNLFLSRWQAYHVTARVLMLLSPGVMCKKLIGATCKSRKRARSRRG